MADASYRHIKIFFKDGREPVEVKKVIHTQWGIVGDGQYFYVENQPETTHDGKDYFEETISAIHYPTADIEHVESKIITRIEGRREILEHKRGQA